MSWTDKELSELAREAEANQAFTYQDSFWGEMEAMLPAKRKRIWPFLLGITLPIVGVAAFLLSTQNNYLETAHVAKKLDFNKNSKLLTATNLTLVDEVVEISPVRNINEEIKTPIKLETNTTKNVARENGLARVQEESKLSIKSRDQITTVETVELVNNNNSNSEANSAYKSRIALQKNEEENVLGPNSVEKSQQQEIIANNNLLGNNKIEIIQEINRLKFAPLSTFEMDKNIQPNSLPYASARRFFSAYGELGFTVGEAYLTKQIGHVQAINIGAGVRLTKNKVFAQMGLGFDIEKASVELQEITRKYDYTLNTFENRMNYKDMYRLTLPITVGYMLNKHTLQLGATPSYLMTTRMKYAYLENNLLKRNEMLYGETRGWNSFGMKVNVGYGFSILPTTTVGANFQVQLLNQLNDNWANDENKLPISGQVFIRKTIR